MFFPGKRNSGFTAIEIMIVLVIVGILLALAYPSYVDYVRKSRRAEAQQLLMNWSITQEIWRSNNAEYATTAQIAVPTNDHYTFTLPTRSATAFVLQATASGDQAKDTTRTGTACSTLNLNSDGLKYSGGDTSITECWN